LKAEGYISDAAYCVSLKNVLCLAIMNGITSTTLISHEQKLSRSESAVIQCLLYFDVFQYPLTAAEILRFNDAVRDHQELTQTIRALLQKKLIREKEDYYFIHESEHIVDRRKKGNAMAAAMMPKAIRYGKFIARFPFVETVCISGGLSKNYVDEQGDVDFFIITKPQRLWLCRSLLVGFKKIFLLNSRKYFCVNYFVDSNNLSIPDRNIFTATEIATLIPVQNNGGYHQFMQENKWIFELLPNAEVQPTPALFHNRKNILKKSGERLFNGNIGDFADKHLFKLTLKVWQKKFKHFSKDDFDLRMRSRKNVSKHHPGGFQEKVLNKLSAAQDSFCKKHQIRFSDR
jgi:hypothetical protein